MSGCCNEYGCKRSKPIRLMQGGLSGEWFIITAYTQPGEGLLRATTKHALADDDAALLRSMQAAADWAMENGYRDHIPPTPAGEGENNHA